MLSVRRGAEAVEFYKSAFAANVVYRIDAPDGAVVARLSIDGAEFWVADESPEHKNFSPETLGGGTVRIVLIKDDPDDAFAKAVAAGAAIVWPVGNQHGWRIGRIVDPFGHHWEIGTRVVIYATHGCRSPACRIDPLPRGWCPVGRQPEG